MTNTKKFITCVALVIIVAGCINTLFGIVSAKDGINIDISYDRIEGAIISGDGVVLCECVDDNHRGTVYFPEIYGSLLGYNSEAMGQSLLRSKFYDTLYAENKSDVGNSIVLTINHDIESFTFNVMSTFKNTDTSAVVIDNKTGRILALLSHKAPLKAPDGSTITCDVNNMPEFTEKVKKAGITLPDAFYIPEWKLHITPGSVFKVVNSIPIVERNLDESIVYNDKGEDIFNSVPVHNYKSIAYGKITLNKALIHSSNVYMANMYFNHLSTATLARLYEKAGIGVPLELDFTTLNSATDLHTTANYIQSSFGQCTAISPLQTASILSAICSGKGTIMKPHLVEEVVNPSGKVIEKTKPEVLTELTDKDTAEKLCSYLLNVGESYKHKGYYMKTGTAQLGDGDVTQNYCFAGTKDITVLISVHDYDGQAKDLKDASARICEYALSASDEKYEAPAESADEEEAGILDRLKAFLNNTEEEAENDTVTEEQAEKEKKHFSDYFKSNKKDKDNKNNNDKSFFGLLNDFFKS